MNRSALVFFPNHTFKLLAFVSSWLWSFTLLIIQSRVFEKCRKIKLYEKSTNY